VHAYAYRLDGSVRRIGYVSHVRSESYMRGYLSSMCLDTVIRDIPLLDHSVSSYITTQLISSMYELNTQTAIMPKHPRSLLHTN
jgi:hypothetical protein